MGGRGGPGVAGVVVGCMRVAVGRVDNEVGQVGLPLLQHSQDTCKWPPGRQHELKGVSLDGRERAKDG